MSRSYYNVELQFYGSAIDIKEYFRRFPLDIRAVRKFINPAVKCLDKVGTGYAVARTKGFNILADGSALTPQAILAAIEEGGLGETNVNRQFTTVVAGKKNKQRSFTFRRTALPTHLRKRLDSALGYVPAVEEVDKVNESRKEVSLICSTSTCWLVEDHVVVAQGEENRENFHVLYSMCNKLNSGDVVRLVYDETYTTMTFPPGTKITFPVCVQRDEPEVQEESGDKEKSDDDEGSAHAAKTSDDKESSNTNESSDEEKSRPPNESSDEEESRPPNESSDEEESSESSDEEESINPNESSDEEESINPNESSDEEESSDEDESDDKEESGDEKKVGEKEGGGEEEEEEEEEGEEGRKKGGGEEQGSNNKEESSDEGEGGQKEERQQQQQAEELSAKTAAIKRRKAQTEAERLKDNLSGWFQPYKKQRTRK